MTSSPVRHAFTNSSDPYTKEMDDALYPSAALPLTAGEVELIKGIFGDAINTDIVRKYYSAKEKPGDPGYLIPAQTFGEDSIKFYGPQYILEDYSKTNNIFNFGSFVHEMTHIWQNQNDIPNKSSRDYEYKVTLQSVFDDDFGWEQQARMIENYARQNLHPACRPLQADPVLQQVIEARFPQAKKTRLALQEQRRTVPKVKPPKVGQLYLF
jgi:hypothetical protein